MYEERFYRDWSGRDGLRRWELKIGESDLLILSDVEDREGAEGALRAARRDIKRYIAAHREFAVSLAPMEIADDAPAIIHRMAEAGRLWRVGPMAAVAGAVAEAVGRRLSEHADTVMVENGGDIFARAPRPLRFALYAGEDSPFAGRLAFELDVRDGIGVCTSSGRVGPSLSLGRADAVVAIHPNVASADAAATAIANRIRSPADVAPVVAAERSHGALSGLIICMGDQLGLFGDLALARR